MAVCLRLPDVPVTVTVYVPAVVPGVVVVVVVVLLPPPQAMPAMETKKTSRTTIASQLRRFFGIQKKSRQAKTVPPPAAGQKLVLWSFMEVVVAVVEMVSVAVAEPLAAGVTELLSKLQPAGWLGAVGLMEQVRSTALAKPSVDWTVMVDVLPEVAPAVSVRLVGLLVMEKSGLPTETLTALDVEMEPDVAITDTE